VRRRSSWLVLAAIGCGSVPAQQQSRAAIGDTLTLESKILGEKRTINVYLPPDYAKSTDRYPVLYMPDGGMAEDFPHVVGSVDVSIKNAVIRPIIVVGVENTERRRDLPGPTVVDEERQAAPHAGGNEKFRSFLRDELKPFITARYRTTAESALIGESLAGLFVLDTFVNEPTLFDGYISADPSVWWNEQDLVRHAHAKLAWWNAGPKQLYIATADYEETQQAVAILLAALRSYAPPGVVWRYEPMPEEHHNTIYPTAALHGIRMVFGLPP
jgi:predicted alpha/beta superfamily hydrolase